MSPQQQPAAFDLDAHIAAVVDRAPSWDELPMESREVLLRVFRSVEPAEVRSA